MAQASHKERSGQEHTSPALARPQRRAGHPGGLLTASTAAPITRMRSCPYSSRCQKASRCCPACYGACCSRWARSSHQHIWPASVAVPQDLTMTTRLAASSCPSYLPLRLTGLW